MPESAPAQPTDTAAPATARRQPTTSPTHVGTADAPVPPAGSVHLAAALGSILLGMARERTGTTSRS